LTGKSFEMPNGFIYLTLCLMLKRQCKITAE
jgi:hypothetical protein